MPTSTWFLRRLATMRGEPSTYWVSSCSVTQLCLTLCDPADCSAPGFSVLHYLPEFAQTHVHWVSDALSPSIVSFSSCLQSFPASGSFPVSWLFNQVTKEVSRKWQLLLVSFSCHVKITGIIEYGLKIIDRFKQHILSSRGKPTAFSYSFPY